MRIPLRPEPAGADIAMLGKPPDWAALFGGDGPLELEIGCGAGGYALEYCHRNPTVRYLAFEWRKKYAREVAYRAERRGLKNLRAVEADARELIPLIFEAETLDAIHLQFPDPWWKRAHQKRSILQLDFTKHLVTLLKRGAKFDFRTDVQERGEKGLTVLEQAGLHNPLGPGAFHPHDPLDVPSTRERRYLVTGQPVYRVWLTRP